jgi:N-acetylglucosaminyl-diphospho-decaprenol L-rhamnosyltransferase
VRLSIVVVCFFEDLGPLLDELARQRADGDEVIVVDNAAQLGGTKGIREHPAVDRVLEAPRNEGFPQAVNLGAAAASGDALVLINPDAVPEPGCLSALREPPASWDAWMGVVTLPDGERVNTAGGRAHYLGFGWTGRFGEPVAGLPEEPYPTGFLSGACLAIRLPAWRELCGFPGHYFLYFDDVDLSHRLRLAGKAFGVVPAARVAHDYEFGKGVRKWRYLERNRWATILRTYPAPLLAVLAPALLLLEPFLLAYAAAGGWLGAKLRSYADLAAWLPRGRAERHAVQRSTVISATRFAEGLTAELDSPFLGAVGRSRLANALIRAYWRAARATLRRF